LSYRFPLKNNVGEPFLDISAGVWRMMGKYYTKRQRNQD
jgi:hypothetical protein